MSTRLFLLPLLLLLLLVAALFTPPPLVPSLFLPRSDMSPGNLRSFLTQLLNVSSQNVRSVNFLTLSSLLMPAAGHIQRYSTHTHAGRKSVSASKLDRKQSEDFWHNRPAVAFSSSDCLPTFFLLVVRFSFFPSHSHVTQYPGRRNDGVKEQNSERGEGKKEEIRQKDTEWEEQENEESAKKRREAEREMKK